MRSMYFYIFINKNTLILLFRLLVQREREMERYVCENKNLKEKWKDAIEDFVKTFEDEICKLRESNTSLESENRELKAKLNI